MSAMIRPFAIPEVPEAELEALRAVSAFPGLRPLREIARVFPWSAGAASG